VSPAPYLGQPARCVAGICMTAVRAWLPRTSGRRDDEAGRSVGQLADREPGACSFTLHVDFLAKNEEQAGFRATLYVQALNTLRSEVGCFQRAHVGRERLVCVRAAVLQRARPGLDGHLPGTVRARRPTPRPRKYRGV